METPSANRPAVLVLENNTEVRELVANMVSAHDWYPVPAATLLEARTILGDRSIDAMVTDLELDDGDSLDLVRELRNSDTASMPIVMISSYATEEVRHAARDAGAIDLLPKPFRMEHLAALLQNNLNS